MNHPSQIEILSFCIS